MQQKKEQKMETECATNLWVPYLSRDSVFPEVFPAATKDTTPQGNNIICSFNGPIHPRLFKPLPNYRVTPSFHHVS